MVCCITLRNTELREAEFFIMDTKHACPLLWKETLSLCSKAVCCINILEKVARNKGEPLPQSQDMQQSERARENCLPTILRWKQLNTRSTDCVFHLFKFLEHTNLTYVGKTFRIVVACGWVCGLTEEGHAGFFWSDNIQGLKNGSGYKSIDICQSYWKVHSKFVHFIIYQFYLKRYWILVNDTHDERFRGEYTDVCNFFWNASKR